MLRESCSAKYQLFLWTIQHIFITNCHKIKSALKTRKTDRSLALHFFLHSCNRFHVLIYFLIMIKMQGVYTHHAREELKGERSPNWLKWMSSGDRLLNDVKCPRQDATAAAAAAVLFTLSLSVMLCTAHWTRGTVPKTWSPRWLIGNTFFSYWALRGE